MIERKPAAVKRLQRIEYECLSAEVQHEAHGPVQIGRRGGHVLGRCLDQFERVVALLVGDFEHPARDRQLDLAQ